MPTMMSMYSLPLPPKALKSQWSRLKRVCTHLALSMLLPYTDKLIRTKSFTTKPSLSMRSRCSPPLKTKFFLPPTWNHSTHLHRLFTGPQASIIPLKQVAHPDIPGPHPHHQVWPRPNAKHRISSPSVEKSTNLC